MSEKDLSWAKHLTILFDADDVAENLCECWIEALNQKYGTNVNVEDVTQWDVSSAFPMLTKEQVYGILQSSAVYQRLSPMPGAQEYLQKLREDGHELYMVTATDYRTCPAKFDRILSLFPWLGWQHVIIASHKQMVRGNVLLDDAPHNLLGGEYVPVLYTRPHNRSFNAEVRGIYRVDSWQKFYDLIHDHPSVFQP